VKLKTHVQANCSGLKNYYTCTQKHYTKNERNDFTPSKSTETRHTISFDITNFEFVLK